MATQPLTAEDLIAAAKRLRRRGMKKSNKKDYENMADEAEVRMKDLIEGLSDDFSTILTLAKKIGNKDVINAIELLKGI